MRFWDGSLGFESSNMAEKVASEGLGLLPNGSGDHSC